MPLDPKEFLGMRVRILPDYFIRSLLPPADWVGTIVAVKQSEMGNPTEFQIHVNGTIEPDEQNAWVLEHEFRQM
jgi:hypothetical protein